MNIQMRAYSDKDLQEMISIWNAVVENGTAFPQLEPLSVQTGQAFFASQTYCGIAEDETGTVVGLYILHPNNVGRCGHIANASYAVLAEMRGQGIGERLVRDCLHQAKTHGFRILQFNAVVKTNTAARRLYEKLGFVPLGEIPEGFLRPDGTYEAIVPYYYTL